MIIVLGSVVLHESHRAAGLALSQAHVARSRLEPGCLAHSVHQDLENPCTLVFVEQWSDQAALFAHFKLPASKAFAKALADMASAPPGMQIFESTALAFPR